MVDRSKHTPVRNVRIPDDLWNEARETAARREESVTDVIKASLQRYVARNRER